MLDRATFERLVLEHLPAAHRFAIRLTGDADSGEDVMQEALLKASRAWRSFAGRSKFRTWLFQIVVNAFRDHRSAKVAAGRDGTGGPLPDDVPDRKSREPSVRMSAAEQGERIARLVSALPPRQREVFVLHAYEGLAPAEIAAVLGLEESNTRANLHFARQRLKQWLAPDLEAVRAQRETKQERPK